MNAATLLAEDNAARPPSGPQRAVVAAPAGQGVGNTAQVLDDPLELSRFTRWIEAAGHKGLGESRLGESSLQLAGLHCAACAACIEAALLAVPGVREARVAAASERATVLWDPQRTQPSAFVAAVQRAGYGAVPDVAAPARALRQREARLALWRLFVAAFCAMQVMMLATPAYVAGAGELSPDLRRLLDWGAWLLTLPVLAFSCGPFFGAAWRSLRAGRIGMDVPVALGIVITFVASSGAAWQPAGPFGSEVYFDSLTMFVSFLLGARWLEMRARHRAAEDLEASLARLPETAQRLLEGEADDGRAETVSVLRLRAGDRVRVALGEAFPADGELIGGSTSCDESLLSGESQAVAKASGDEVVGGSLNLGAPVLMRVVRAGAHTRLEGIVAMMRGAATQRPALARLADRWAGPFLWAVLLLAAGGAAVWSVLDPSRALWVAVSVLIVTCPCALSLAAPATLLATARALARRGVTVQELDAIQALANAQHFFIDKTGTLTADLPRLADVTLTEAGRRRFANEAAAVAAAARLAAWSRHPLSQAIVRASRAHDPAAARTEALADIVEEPGHGVRAIDAAGLEWRLGSLRFAAAASAAPEPIAMQGAATPGGCACLSVGGEALALMSFEESLRAGAAVAVAALRAEGVRITMLSGDRADRARALAARLGIAEVVADAKPEHKLAAVAAAQAEGRRVAMVGDGINDAPVLARADVGVAMGEGAIVARVRAGLVLASGRADDIVVARRLAQRALRIVRQNLAWAAAYNATCVPLALAGWLPPWAAGLGMAASSLLVVGNALRVAR